MIAELNKGCLLAKRYQLLELIGQGAMGHVYCAEDRLLGGVTVAVKFLSQTILNQRTRDRFEREAKICALLGERSIHIVRVRDYGVDEHDLPFYVMEFLQGESLGSMIESQSLSLSRFLNVVRQICLGLQCAHQGIIFQGEQCRVVHRDIKPNNIMVIQDSTLGELVKILDFGVAKLVQANNVQTHSFTGTLAYCSPEQIEGRELDNRSDIYSLGVMMYEMLTGEFPLFPETYSVGGWYKVHHYTLPKAFDPDLKVPPALEKLVMRCLAKAPSNRPQSVSEILRALEPLEKRLGNGYRWGLILKEEVDKGAMRTTFPPVDEICLQASWPTDKPQQKIVFPHLVYAPQEVLATLWVMLGRQDMENRRASMLYNQFLCLMSPHPMLLWITVLYNREYGSRWLPCYLDLKTPAGQQFTRILGKSAQGYRILLFALENPQQCMNVMTATIEPLQRYQLLEWANDGLTLGTSSQPQISKGLLKRELEKLKPKILKKLEAAHSDAPTGVIKSG